MKPRIVCIGHSALDRIYRIAAFPPTPTKVRAIEHAEAGGGMAANAAAAIATLGGAAELWSRVGDDDAGRKIIAGLKVAGVDTRYVQAFEEGRSSTSAIIVDGKGERLIVGARDVNMPSGTSWLPLERISGAAVVLGDVRWLEGLRQAFGEARRLGIPTVLDAELGARDALREIVGLADYAIFSSASLEDLLPGQSRARRLAKVLALGAGHAGVTAGADGYYWQEPGGDMCHQPAYTVPVVDTTGAGDAFHGAFALGLAKGLDSAGAARLAAATAALKCTRLGSRAGLPTWSEVQAFLARH